MYAMEERERMGLGFCCVFILIRERKFDQKTFCHCGGLKKGDRKTKHCGKGSKQSVQLYDHVV